MSHRSRIAAAAALVCALGVLVTPVGALWIDGGVPLCILPYDQEDLVIASDGAGGAIIAWEGPHSTTEWDIFCQRVSSGGATLWTENGAAVCDTAGAQGQAAIASDGTGGAIICWTDKRYGDWDVFAQRMSADGSPLWGPDGIPIARLDREQSNNQIVEDGAGGAIIVWHSYGTENGWDIYAQRVSADGDLLWGAHGIAVCNASSSQVFPQIASDGFGGAVIAWQDGRTGTTNDIYTQRIDENGAFLWTTNGVATCTAANSQSLPHIVSDGAGGAIVTWYDSRNGRADIYAQRLGSGGMTLWTADGVTICDADEEQYDPRPAPDGAGGAIITWYDHRSGTSYDVYAQRVSAAGAALWTPDGIPVSTATGDQKNPEIVPDGAGGAVIVWEAPGHAYMQRLDEIGTPLWTADGVSICPGSGATIGPVILSRGADGVILAWEDGRPDEGWDPYAALFDGNGALVPTLLAGWDAVYRDGAIRLSWELTELVPVDELTVCRRDADRTGAPWEKLAAPIEVSGLSYGAVDASCEPGGSYAYRVDVVEDGAVRTLFETAAVSTPTAALALHQNRPNPFNPSTVISFSLPRESTVRIEIYDATGRLVGRLLDGNRLPAGPHAVEWNGRDARGRVVPSGVYFCRLTAGKERLSRKLVVAR